MTHAPLPETTLLRLQFLGRVVQKECQHLELTDRRLFATPFTLEHANSLEHDSELAERVEAFVGRFGRRQDTLGDKLLPVLLTALGERTGAAIDNLDRAERFGLIQSSEEWMAMPSLRNQMIHEYIEDPGILASALNSGHDFVGTLVKSAENMQEEFQQRGWSD